MSAELPTVLVVDPDSTIVELGAAVAQAAALHYRGVPSAAQAMEALKAQPFSLVVLEQDLPDASGVELLEEILRLYPHQPCMFYTASCVPLEGCDLHGCGVGLFPKTMGHHRFWTHLAIAAPLAHSMMKLRHSNEMMTRRIERVAPLERMIGRYAERWRVSHDIARRIITDFARNSRVSLLHLAEIAEDRNEEVDRALQDLERARMQMEARLKDSEPGLLLQLDDFASARLSAPSPSAEAG